MALSQPEVAAFAEALDAAQRERRLLARLAETPLAVGDGYRVQRELQKRRLARGEKLVGYKMGLTSLAKMKQIGLSSPVFGFLTDGHRAADKAELDTASLAQPRVEPEIAFILARPLEGECSIEEVLAATAAIAPAIEVLDSRFNGFKFDLASAIADNTSAARFVVGESRKPVAGIDLAKIGVVVRKNGAEAARGTGENVLGHPARSVAMLAAMLKAEGTVLPAGAIVMTGGITEAIPVGRGDKVQVSIDALGTVSAAFN
jgi:2-oxo-3-hexenedioate decarboxylase